VVARLDGEDGVAGDRLDGVDGGVEAVEFLLGGEDVQPLVRGFEADVDDICTLVDHAVDVRGGLAGVVEDARLVRRLLGDVEHAHDSRRIVVSDSETGGVDVSHVSRVGRDD